MTRREEPDGACPHPAGSGSPPGRPGWRRGRPGAGRANVGAVAATLLGIFLWPGLAPAQERDCQLVKVGGYTESRRQDSINYTHRASGGVDYRCTDGTRILADSAVVWEHSGNAFFFGSVHFEDPDTELDADSARYLDITRELIAYSNVVLTDRKGGAVIRGQTLSYLSESRFRNEDRILVYGGSPRAVVYPARRPAAPVSVAETDPAEEGAGGQGEDPAADSLTGEAGDPAEDSIAEQAGPVSDSADATVVSEDDSLQAGTGDPVEDSLAGLPGRAPGAGLEDEFAELARLDSLAGITAEPSAETDAEPGADAVSAGAAVDSVTPLPYEVEAPRIMIDGRRFFRAGGGVVVTRDSLRAAGDSLDYDQDVGAMLILGEASVEDSGFRLKGLSVAVTPTAGLDEEILAREDAELTGEEVLMTAPAIRLFLEDGQVGRLVALPTVPRFADDGAEVLDTAGLTPGDAERVRAMAEAAAAAAAEEDSLNSPDSLPRPSVVAAEFNLTGDSIEVLSPGQLLDVVTAVGAARADAMGQDSLAGEDLPEIARNDWMEGETIIARFAPADSGEDSAAADPGPAGTRARLETLTAVTDARSFYRLYTSDTTQADADTTGAAPVANPDEPDPAPEELPAATEEATTATEEAATDSEEPDPAAQEDGAAAEECDTTGADDEGRPELHYVSGNQITIFLEGRQVVKMEVTGQTRGYHFEPVPPDCESAAEDSAAVAPDTDTVPPDTLSTPPDTTRPPPHLSTAAQRYTLSARAARGTGPRPIPTTRPPRRAPPPSRPIRLPGAPA
ncbi:MAG: hypothetical protein OXQ93_12665 [Gemmatimonadota bacterium]|nr:hypothetical protein [Gemmatimonadota bacterium]